MERQRAVALAVARAENWTDARILDIGCGTGWLANELTPYGSVTGIDLSPAAIEHGRRRYPTVRLECGSFDSFISKNERFDMIVAADSLAHVPDQPLFLNSVRDLLKPGGVFLLMTQNPRVWHRKRTTAKQGEGQIRDWPSLARIRRMLPPSLVIEQVGSIVPGGDSGALWWVENRWVRRGAGLLLGRERYQSLLERALLGRELVVVCRATQ